ncbi:MAG: hypothetical protein KIH63_000775 [Candidatus Saccharibacteria bacterium]|nr:hypothetical protein [Candidatus Saccharibacteria bacterium]
MDNKPASTGTQLSNTGNPQDIGGQNITAPKTDLQTTLTQSSNSTNFNITSVGDSTFKPFEASTTTSSSLGAELDGTVPTPVKGTNFMLVAGVAIIVLLLCALTTWVLYKDSQKRLIKRA